MNKNTESGISHFIQSENLLTVRPDKTALEATLQAIESALLCLGEGNIARAAVLLYSALPEDRRPIR
jgi:hypothetical protein